jgi:ferredoxin
MPTVRTPRPARSGRLLAGVSCAVLLTACGGGDTAEEAVTSSASSASKTTVSPAPESASGQGGGLARGLLPAEAFGENATVIALSREQLEQGAGLAADPESLDISPESCAAAVSSTQPQIDDYDDVAAQSATVGATTTVEVLLQGEATEGSVEQLAEAAASCPEAQISSPELGEATLQFEALDAPDLGDGVAVVRYTTTLTQGGQEVSVPALVGLVQDADRVVTLLTIATDGSSPDAAQFTSLLEQAFEVQAEAFG